MFESAPKPCTGMPLLRELHVHFDRSNHRIQQILIVEGLLQEVDGTEFHRTNTGGYVTVGGDEDDGRIKSPVRHTFLKGEAIHARHPDVEHQAAWLIRGGLSEIGLGRLESPDGVARGPKQPGQRRANTLVVVHHVDGELTLKCGSSCAHSNLSGRRLWRPLTGQSSSSSLLRRLKNSPARLPSSAMSDSTSINSASTSEVSIRCPAWALLTIAARGPLSFWRSVVTPFGSRCDKFMPLGVGDDLVSAAPHTENDRFDRIGQ